MVFLQVYFVQGFFCFGLDDFEWEEQIFWVECYFVVDCFGYDLCVWVLEDYGDVGVQCGCLCGCCVDVVCVDVFGYGCWQCVWDEFVEGEGECGFF